MKRNALPEQERIQALSHQNGELKKRVIWNVAHLMQDTQHRPSKNEVPPSRLIF